MRAARNIYKDDVDFTSLALQSPAFAKYVKPNGQLDFSDPDAVRQLTKSLLKRDFNLNVEIPENRLCPPVPNRLNYIQWLQDLLDTTGDQYRDDYDPDRFVLGLDIGTGCCSIYPLLGCMTRPLWDFVATDIDDENVRNARENVINNELGGRIRVFKTEPKDDLIPLDTKLDVQRLDFTMCNPPFYASREEMVASAETKERPPFSACTGAEVEMVTEGGEIAFVYRMIEESLRLRERVVWYTSMLGKLSSVSVIVEKLMEHGNNNYAVTEFVQGSKTRRWAVAWSWTDLRPSMNVARGIPGFPKHLLPFPSEFMFEIMNQSIDDIGDKIDKEICSLRIHWIWRKNLATGVGFAMENVWSRQARRKLQNSARAADMMEIDDSAAALGFKIQLKQDRLDEKCVRVVVRWLKGLDSVLFESFCGMLKRKVEGR
ncbi:putative methyltransferase-like protein C27D7.08c [Aspergillus lentulus]|nr:putative methyltransferase-like protein C27D7.08c [Aspergillus lentulus]